MKRFMPNIIQFKRLYPVLQDRELAAKYGVHKDTVRKFAKKQKIKKSPDFILHRFPGDVDEFKRLYPQCTNKELMNIFKLKDYQVANYAILFKLKKQEGHQNAGHFKEDHTPWNAGKKGIFFSPETQFKKGHIPGNTLKEGDIVIRNEGENRKIKWIKHNGKMMYLSRKIWEDSNGEIPKGMCIIFKDGDPMNCVIDNLDMITRGENAIRNRKAALNVNPIEAATDNEFQFGRALRELRAIALITIRYRDGEKRKFNKSYTLSFADISRLNNVVEQIVKLYDFCILTENEIDSSVDFITDIIEDLIFDDFKRLNKFVKEYLHNKFQNAVKKCVKYDEVFVLEMNYETEAA